MNFSEHCSNLNFYFNSGIFSKHKSLRCNKSAIKLNFAFVRFYQFRKTWWVCIWMIVILQHANVQVFEINLIIKWWNRSHFILARKLFWTLFWYESSDTLLVYWDNLFAFRVWSNRHFFTMLSLKVVLHLEIILFVGQLLLLSISGMIWIR